MQNSELIVRGTLICNSEKVIIDGALVVKGDIIDEISDFSSLRKKYPEYQVIGSQDSIVVPGFVNTHSHAVQTIFRGAGDDRELMPWLNEVILPGEATLTPEELYASCRVGYAEMLLSGITTTNDMLTGHNATQGYKAAMDSGIRGKIGKMLMDRNVPKKLIQDIDTVLDELECLIEQYPTGGRIEVSVTPRFIIACTDKMMKKSVEFAKKHNLLFHTHVAENKGEGRFVEELTGLSYFNKMEELGTFQKNSIFAHCVWTSQNEMSKLKQSRVSISHNPSSNGKLASGIAPVNEFLENGINIGLATDGSPATGGHDFFLEMKLANYFQKARTNIPTILPATQVFDMATRMGARTLGYDNIGELKVGYKADIVILSRNAPNAYPMYNPISFVVYTATKREVETVIVDGQIIVQNGRLLQDISDEINVLETYASEKPFLTRDPQ